MDKGTLVDRAKDDGARFLAALDAGGFPATAALWVYEPEAEEWRLVIGTPVVDTKGPKEVYTALEDTLESMQPKPAFGLNDVWVVSPKERLLQLLGTVVDTGPGIAGLSFENNVLNGILLPDAYIYRIRRPSPHGR